MAHRAAPQVHPPLQLLWVLALVLLGVLAPLAVWRRPRPLAEWATATGTHPSLGIPIWRVLGL